MAENSFDIVSRVDLQEVSNAVQQAMKEISQRFDFRGSKSNIELDSGKNEILLVSDDEYKLKSVVDILEGKLIKRKVPVKALNYGKVEDAALGTVRQVVSLQQGIPTEKGKEIVKIIIDNGAKVNVKNNIDKTALMRVKEKGYTEIIIMLEEAGAKE